MLCMRGHISAGIFTVTSYSCKVNRVVLIHDLLPVQKTSLYALATIQRKPQHLPYKNKKSERKSQGGRGEGGKTMHAHHKII